MSWNWQYTSNSWMESKESYLKDYQTFEKKFLVNPE